MANKRLQMDKIYEIQRLKTGRYSKMLWIGPQLKRPPGGLKLGTLYWAEKRHFISSNRSWHSQGIVFIVVHLLAAIQCAAAT